jgi:hypothetical protein
MDEKRKVAAMKGRETGEALRRDLVSKWDTSCIERGERVYETTRLREVDRNTKESENAMDDGKTER